LEEAFFCKIVFRGKQTVKRFFLVFLGLPQRQSREERFFTFFIFGFGEKKNRSFSVDTEENVSETRETLVFRSGRGGVMKHQKTTERAGGGRKNSVFFRSCFWWWLLFEFLFYSRRSALAP
jgi:hypothetical protein